jgi:TonB family protein
MRVEASPPFERIPQAPGTLSYSFMTYDIDDGGVASNVRLVSSSGNDVLDRESVRAVAAFRFAPGARTGCTHYFFRRGGVSEAPPLPEEGPYRRPDATCPKEPPEWAYMPALVFPAAFNRRGVQGWAVVRYDLTPEGATRNVEPLDYAPARGFAEEAVRIVLSARKPGDGRAYSGCIGRVRFELPTDDPRVRKAG